MTRLSNLRIKAVVFDLDGTLVDSAPGLQTAINGVLEAQDCPPIELADVQSMIGDGIPALINKAFAQRGRTLSKTESTTATRQFREIYADCGPRETPLFPGARNALQQLSFLGISLGLCTNKPQRSTEPLLDALRIDHYFSAVFGGDLLAGIRKPDPRHVLAVLGRLGIDAAEAVMVGDSPNDIDAGQGAGMPVIAVTYGYALGPVDALGADYFIDSLTELPALLVDL
jgi:phosphoglycolate phosphatase